ncbi:MAG: cytochrome c oxidase subunit II [Gaiellaceae bacterium]
MRAGVPGGRAALLLVPAALVLAGCGKEQNALAPESHQARDIASLFWWMMGGAWIGLGLVVALLLLAWKRRNRRGLGSDTEGDKPGERAGWVVVVGMGIVVPILLLSALFLISDVFVIRTTQAPAANATERTVLVIGHQFWWEVRYPGTSVVTANEIHIPARTAIRLEVRTEDVIHSFWVPELNRKIDTLPGKTNAIELYAEAPGRYRGQCAEFCGLQHAHMGLYVFADPPAQFSRWLARESRPAGSSSGAEAGRGRDEFLNGECSTCHTIRGTSADANVGPDLTHVESRSTLAALTLPNDREHLREWIRDPQHFKPGSDMPSLALSGSQLDSLVAYLESLR